MSMRIDWHGFKGFRELRTSAAALSLVEAEAQKVRDRAQAGAGRSEFGMTSTSGRNRAGALVYTANPAAMVRNARDNTLIRALGRG